MEESHLLKHRSQSAASFYVEDRTTKYWTFLDRSTQTEKIDLNKCVISYFLYLLCVVCVCVLVGGQLGGISSLFIPCRFQVLNIGLRLGDKRLYPLSPFTFL